MRFVAIGLLGTMLAIGSAELSCPTPFPKNVELLEAERRGCCSHHGGVCGCEKGRALCCDGRLSPSCGCD